MPADRIADGANFTLRDEIKAYWSARAATFDQSPGHEIFPEEERAAWHALIERHLGHGEGRKALDLASGTGVISHLMDDLGYKVTGIDWSESMLALARAKAGERGRSINCLDAGRSGSLFPRVAARSQTRRQTSGDRRGLRQCGPCRTAGQTPCGAARKDRLHQACGSSLTRSHSRHA